MNIELTYTGEQKIYHDHHKPFIVKASIDLPKMYNAGWNCFMFEGGEPNFSLKNELPLRVKLDSEKYTFFETEAIEVTRKDGTTCSGYFTRTIRKEDNHVTNTFNFS